MSENVDLLWYYAENGRQSGPVSNAEFLKQISRGAITPETLVWHSGMSAWEPYGGLAGKTAAGTGEAPCHYCGKVFPSAELIDFSGTRVCAACKPLFVQQFKENAEAAPPLTRRYAGFWIRVVASIIDGILCNIISQMFVLPLTLLSRAYAPGESAQLALVGLSSLIPIIPGFIYYTWPLVKYGATPGKMACGLKVIRSDGSALSWGRAIGRQFATMLSSMILFIGYIMAALDKVEHKTLHDIICDTRVIYKGK
jgi:uncharacterized RDD family membrane protein YckC